MIGVASDLGRGDGQTLNRGGEAGTHSPRRRRRRHDQRCPNGQSPPYATPTGERCGAC
jgi:hypothetical protein